jgi:hypothetical protein
VPFTRNSSDFDGTGAPDTMHRGMLEEYKPAYIVPEVCMYMHDNKNQIRITITWRAMSQVSHLWSFRWQGLVHRAVHAHREHPIPHFFTRILLKINKVKLTISAFYTKDNWYIPPLVNTVEMEDY